MSYVKQQPISKKIVSYSFLYDLGKGQITAL
jgi:hypothetical protein